MHILIAPNAFKNSLSAAEAAAAIATGLQQSSLECTYECFPIADGGNGTAELILQKCNGKTVIQKVDDPLGRIVAASYGLIDESRTAVIEMASASGLHLLKPDELNPLRALSTGTGQLIKAALQTGIRKIIIAMGGSATVDGGTGILSALGLRFLDRDGNALNCLPENLIQLEAIDTSQLQKEIIRTEVIVLCDVDNRLLGEKGAAAVFGPQKGATPEAVKKLESALAKFNEITKRETGIDMSALEFTGTAGGAAGGLHAYLNARLEKGIDYFLDLTHFEESLEKADLVITGEGSIDEQTLQGKGPFGVAKRARQKHKPVIGVAGKVPSHPGPSFKKYFDLLFSIRNDKIELSEALLRTAEDLTLTATQIGNQLNKTGLSFL